MIKTINCTYCGKEFVPKRRGAQKFCSNSCRSRNWQIKNRKKNLALTNVDLKSKPKSESSDKITAAGVANTALGVTAVEIVKKILTPEIRKNATKEDIEYLATLIKGKRFYPVQNLPINNFGKRPFFDVQTERIIYL